jgi:dihydroxy-acid dehydratase
VRDGDRIVVDSIACELRVEVSEAELSARRAVWAEPPRKATSGVLGKYVRLVKSASEGCVTD